MKTQGFALLASLLLLVLVSGIAAGVITVVNTSSSVSGTDLANTRAYYGAEAAMEKMAESIRQAKSYKCVQILEVTEDFPLAGEPAVTEHVYTVHWLAPGSARSERTKNPKTWKGPGNECGRTQEVQRWKRNREFRQHGLQPRLQRGRNPPSALSLLK